MRYIVICVNGGAIHRLRFDPNRDDDRLYVSRQLESILDAAPPPSNYVRVWIEDEQLTLSLR